MECKMEVESIAWNALKVELVKLVAHSVHDVDLVHSQMKIRLNVKNAQMDLSRSQQATSIANHVPYIPRQTLAKPNVWFMIK